MDVGLMKGYDAYAQKAEIARKGGLEGAVAGFMKAAVWGTPDRILRELEARHGVIGDFELNVSFRFGGIPYDKAEASLRLFAREVMPVLKSWQSPAAKGAIPARLRPRRSVLFMPGSNPRALEKARGLPADGLIFDLEDAVAPEAKETARLAVAAAVMAGGYAPRELVLRVNPIDTVWGHADLATAATLPIDAVLLPKVESAERVRLSIDLLDASGAPPGVALRCMIETPLGVLEADDIAGASPRIAALVMGTSDLANDLDAGPTRDRPLLVTAVGLVLLGARAYGRAVLDGVHHDLGEAEGFATACHQ